VSDPDPGLPEGWSGIEAEHLRFGVWRFYRIVDPDERSSVSEDNWVTRDGVAASGEAGLRAFLADLRSADDDVERVPPDVLAAQVGHFLIRGESRQSCDVLVVEDDRHGASPPSRALVDGRLVIRAWFQRDGYRQPVEVEQDAGGAVTVRWGDIAIGR
jgi:predicted ATPase